jgi:hypothetical protein
MPIRVARQPVRRVPRGNPRLHGKNAIPREFNFVASYSPASQSHDCRTPSRHR